MVEVEIASNAYLKEEGFLFLEYLSDLTDNAYTSRSIEGAANTIRQAMKTNKDVHGIRIFARSTANDHLDWYWIEYKRHLRMKPKASNSTNLGLSSGSFETPVTDHIVGSQFNTSSILSGRTDSESNWSQLQASHVGEASFSAIPDPASKPTHLHLQPLVECLSHYICDITLLEYCYLSVPPSILATCSMLLAHALLHPVQGVPPCSAQHLQNTWDTFGCDSAQNINGDRGWSQIMYGCTMGEPILHTCDHMLQYLPTALRSITNVDLKGASAETESVPGRVRNACPPSNNTTVTTPSQPHQPKLFPEPISIPTTFDDYLSAPNAIIIHQKQQKEESASGHRPQGRDKVNSSVMTKYSKMFDIIHTISRTEDHT